MPDIRLPTDPSGVAEGEDADDDLPDAAVRALADHLTEAFEGYLETHLPPPGAQTGPDDLTPRAILAGVTLFHASLLVQIAQEVLPEATARFCEVQVRSFANALDALQEEDSDAR